MVQAGFADFLRSFSELGWTWLAILLVMMGFGLWVWSKHGGRDQPLVTFCLAWPRNHPWEFGLWLGLGAVLAGILCLALSLETDLTILERRHEKTAGTFVKDLHEHDAFTCSFEVHGRRYLGSGRSDQQSAKTAAAGKPFDVYYDPLNPTRNLAAEPHQAVNDRNTDAVSIGLLVVFWLAIGIRKLGGLVLPAATARPAASR